MATKTTINISPKVLTGLLTGLGAAAALGAAGSVTPHTFDFLGPWGPVAKLAFTVLLAQAAAWFKREQAAETKAAEQNADGSYNVTSLPVPLVPASFDQIVSAAPASDPLVPLVPPTA